MDESQVQQCFIPVSVISHEDVQASYPTSEPTESTELPTEESKANDFMDVKELESELEVPPDEVNEVISEVIGGTHPFDISIFDSCVSIQESSSPVHLNSPQEEKVTESYVATEGTQDNTNSSHDVGEATSSSAIVYTTPKRPAAKRKRRAPMARIYYCDWCRVAQFKSGQGLRFHRTLRCSAREKHLGEFVTQMPLSFLV